jgi:hypothetical protein
MVVVAACAVRSAGACDSSWAATGGRPYRLFADGFDGISGGLGFVNFDYTLVLDRLVIIFSSMASSP